VAADAFEGARPATTGRALRRRLPRVPSWNRLFLDQVQSAASDIGSYAGIKMVFERAHEACMLLCMLPLCRRRLQQAVCR
jgi:hypothetical protein